MSLRMFGGRRMVDTVEWFFLVLFLEIPYRGKVTSHVRISSEFFHKQQNTNLYSTLIYQSVFFTIHK